MGMFSLVILLTVVVVLVIRLRNGRKKRILLTDFRRGVHFVGGSFKSVLGPGSYRYDARTEQIIIIDMRPQPILIERLAFQDALRNEGVISVGTELLVREPRLSATALRDQVNDAYVMVRDTVRIAMSKQIATSTENTTAIAKAITTVVNEELSKVGIAVSEIEITELSSQTIQPQTTGASGTIQ